jgi:hypothetical protein
VDKIQYWQASDEQRAAMMAGNLLRLLAREVGGRP